MKDFIDSILCGDLIEAKESLVDRIEELIAVKLEQLELEISDDLDEVV